jgi:Predicted membrane protein (DUF2127)
LEQEREPAPGKIDQRRLHAGSRAQRIGRAVSFVLLLSTAFLGIINGPSDLREVESTGQFVVGLAVTIYGVAGLTAAYGLWRRKRWTAPWTMIWAVGAITAASVSPIAYGAGEVTTGVGVTSGVAAAAIVGAVLLFVFWELRHAPLQ